MKDKQAKSVRIIFLIVGTIHALLLMIPYGPMIIKKAEQKVIQISLILPNKNLTVVDVPYNEEALESIPENAKYLSDRNQKVLEETVAKPIKPKSHIALGDLGETSMNEKMSDTGIIQKKQGGEKVAEDISLTDGYQSGDFLENVQESDKTSINTIQFKYFGFYKRIKDQVESRWHSLLFKHVPEGTKLHKDVETIVLIKVDKEGRIIGSKIEQDSGLPFLDKITIITFEKIEYFHNPPKELFNDREFLYIQWGFKVGL